MTRSTALNNSLLQEGGYLNLIKARWIEDGEKPTKYFLNLEKRNFVNKQMAKMERDDGNLVTRQDEFMNEVVKFYDGLYTVKENVIDESDSDMIKKKKKKKKKKKNLPHKQLTDKQSKKLLAKFQYTNFQNL